MGITSKRPPPEAHSKALEPWRSTAALGSHPDWQHACSRSKSPSRAAWRPSSRAQPAARKRERKDDHQREDVAT